ncbi:hypothetical protein SAMN04515679_3920 [Pelosinus fermentans]|uniref:MotA/TolQ/ExbB proton channel domain-containing protein n=1 Tax=Pelosinus fermentans B4 TaxID=1149862 RepID=I9L7V1_9FIRM|nr:hypothetical protein FB4_0960 [Pelosinus fermentans B4]EIW22570.1 hypothetical protein FA11_0153 [Pelosinus fermentans A11]OAM95756.1 hypothetical protein FR7_03777 [Pelosinus fermentans DSM 17108]SDR32441.1 hypothetical protein SAMN04515679_3920 [Pelosinus fermentans]
MQSGEFLKQIVLFILVPESIVSLLFLVVLLGIFIYGIMKLNFLKQEFIVRLETIETEYNKQSKKLDPNVFLRMKLQEFEASEYKITSIPNILVSVGILATFLGLGIALKQASEILSSVGTVELLKLNSVLAIIAFKFQTSVWGLTLSILFQKFAIDYFVTLKQEYQQRALETLYANKKTGIEDLLEKQSLLLEAQLKEIQHFNHSVGSLEQSSSSFAKSAIGFIQTTDSLKHVVNTFNLTTAESLNIIEERLESVFKEQLEKINVINEATLTTHQQAGKMLQIRLNHMESATENQLAAMYKQVDNLMVETRNILVENINKMNNQMLSGMVKIANQTTIVNEQSMEVQQDSIRIIKDALQGNTIQINRMLDHVDSNLNHTINSTVESLNKMQAETGSDIKVALGKVNEDIRRCLDGASTGIDKFTGAIDGLDQNINHSFLSVGRQLTKLDDYTNHFSSTNHAVYETIGKLEREIKGIAAALEKLAIIEPKLPVIHVSGSHSLETSPKLRWSNNLISIEENRLDTASNKKADFVVIKDES